MTSSLPQRQSRTSSSSSSSSHFMGQISPPLDLTMIQSMMADPMFAQSPPPHYLSPRDMNSLLMGMPLPPSMGGDDLPLMMHPQPAQGMDPGQPFDDGASLSMSFNTPDVKPSTFQIGLVLRQLSDRVHEIGRQVVVIASDQKMLPVPPQAKEPYEMVDRLQHEAAKVIEASMKEIEMVKQTVLLPPQDIMRLNAVNMDFLVLLKQLEVYAIELRHMASADCLRPKCFASVLITKQPFPKCIKQHIKTSTSVDDPVVVKLFSPAKGDIRPKTACKAELLHEDYQAKRNEVTVQNDTQNFNPQGIATFVDLRFPQGTRLKAVRLQFSAQLEFVQPDGAIGSTMVESEPSNSFVVMTNENQWDVAEGMLLQRDTFGGNSETTWFNFANMLQIHYLKATRQDACKPQRPLSAADMAYIHEHKLDLKPVVSLRDFEKFWEWFGKVLHRIRHQRHLSMLWLRGLIYGFIPKEAAEDLLRNEEVGTFLLRFSERIAGQFAVAFVAASKNEPGLKEVKHYLLKPDDITGPNKTLADFLKVHENFLFLVEKKVDFLPEGLTIRGSYAKNEILEEFYSKKNFTSIDGYEEEVD